MTNYSQNTFKTRTKDSAEQLKNATNKTRQLKSQYNVHHEKNAAIKTFPAI